MPTRSRRSLAWPAERAGGCSDWFCRPTPTELAIVGTRKSTVAAPPERTDTEDAALGGAAVGDVQVPVLVERDPVGAGVPVAKPVATGGLAGLAALGLTTPISSPAAPNPVR